MEATPEKVGECLAEVGIGFLFAPNQRRLGGYTVSYAQPAVKFPITTTIYHMAVREIGVETSVIDAVKPA